MGRLDTLSFCRSVVRYWMREVLGGAQQRREWRRAGIDVRSVPLWRLGLDGARAHNHACSGGPDLARVLNELAIAPEHSILDLGCGKGGAMITMAQFAFRRIVGLDLSAELLEVARANLRRAGVERFDLIQGDAMDFEGYDDFTHIYMYNPFPAIVMRTVVERLQESLRRKPRTLTIVYKNPTCHDEIVRDGVFMLQRRFDHSGHPFFVYVPRTGREAASDT